MDELIERLHSARSVFVLTGSGISAESGPPTFRGCGGLWRTQRIEELASPYGFAAPCAGHYALAALEARYSDFTLATQNVETPDYSRNPI
jgi:NAD-dependent deacetylase